MSENRPSSNLHIEQQKQGELTIIRLKGRFRVTDFKHFNRVYQQFLDEDGKWLVLDLEEMQVMQSSVVGSILSTSRLLTQLGKRMAIVRPSEHILYIFELCRLTEIVPVYPTMEEAMQVIEEDLG